MEKKLSNNGIINFWKNLTDSQFDEINKRNLEESKKENESFLDGLAKNHCYLCDLPLSTFNEDKICLHWLMRPNGLKKNLLNKLFKSGIGYFRINTYLRWLANTEVPFKNINDYSEKKDNSMLFEETIKYRQYEWSFSCCSQDYQGHKGGNSAFPHFHLQMTIDGKLFVKFSEYHIPFNNQDIFFIKSNEVIPGRVRLGPYYGEGMNYALNKMNLESLIDAMQTTTDEKNATFHLQTRLEASEGEAISGDEIADIIEESKRTGVPLSVLAKKIKANVTTIVTPGPGVVPPKKRK